MAVERIAVEAHLGVEHEQIAILGFDQRIDLEHFDVELHEGFVKLLGELLALLVGVARQFEREGDRAAVMRHEALRRVDRDGADLFGRVVGDRFDIHPAFGRGDHRDLARRAIDQQRQVIFLRDVDAIGHVEAIDLLAFIAGLRGDQRVAEHVFRRVLDFVDRLGEADAALGIGVQFLELALAAAAGVDLGLHDIHRARQPLGGSDGFLDRQRGVTGGNRDPVLCEQFLGLVFVNVHGSVFPQGMRGFV